MLLVSAFTFFGLSALQNVSYFTNLFGDVKITINITAQEEENETSNNEVKEIQSKISAQEDSFAINKCNISNAISYRGYSSKTLKGFLEVATPPPRIS
jgi:hypothetical protein